jgi:hypothetical protein
VNKFISSAIVAAGLLFGAQGAHAYAIYTDTAIVAATKLDWVGPPTLSSADVTVGLNKYNGVTPIDSVTLTWTSDTFVIDGGITNGNRAGVLNFTVGNLFQISPSNATDTPTLLSQNWSLAAFTNYAVAANSSVSLIGDLYQAVTSVTFSGADVAQFLGSGQYLFDIQTWFTGSFLGSAGGSFGLNWDAYATGTLTVAYEVPTPAPLALLGVGLAALAGFVRRRRAV